MPGAEKRASDYAVIAASLNKGVAANTDRVSKIAIVPCRAGADFSGRRIRSPMFQIGEVKLPVESSQIDAKISIPSDRLHGRRQSQKTARPCYRFGQHLVVCQIRPRRWAERPRLRQAVSHGDTESNRPVASIEPAANVKRRVIPRSKVFKYLVWESAPAQVRCRLPA